VVHALEAASFVMTELSRERQHVDKQLLHAAATGFIQQIQVRVRTEAALDVNRCCSAWGGGRWCVLNAVRSVMTHHKQNENR
jgi:hypothetical protein